MRFFSVLVTLTSLAGFASAGSGVYEGGLNKRFRKRTPEGIEVDVFEHASTNSSIEYVTNSGICETTPGVNQYSGYLNVGTNMSMFFWFFEARHNPDTAPVSIWLNGGPGCSSMIGLFQENGPCHFTNITQAEPVLNPYSWNEYANMLYIDQPIGTGFSVGTRDVNSTVTAAPYIWKFMQAFFANFPQYKSREFGLFTESFGGHYGPEFAKYFLEQNDKIDAGCVKGDKIDMIALGINNGWIEPKYQYLTYATYAYNNPYRQLLDNASYAQAVEGYEKYCVPAIDKCRSTVGDDDACAEAKNACQTQMMTNLVILSKEDFNLYDVRISSTVEDPPKTYIDYITTESVRKKIGVRSRFYECDETVYSMMNATGDDARSFVSVLEEVVNRNISTLIWAGDADWICNWEGNFHTVNSLKWHGQDEFANKTVKPYTVDGELYGEYKTVDNLSWLKVYGAGHEVPYYQPEVALQAFIQTMKRKPLSPT